MTVDAATSERCSLTQRFEAGVHERVVVIEFDSVAAAIAAHDCEPCQEVPRALDHGAVRDIRIVESL